MYESPIQVEFSDLKIETLKDKADQVIVRACQEMAPFVNKEELIKALQYDRDQYLKGYTDGLSYTPPVKTHYDQVKAMTIEEMATWLERIRLCCATDLCGRSCPFAEVCYSNAEHPIETIDWLKQEANDAL